MKPIAFVALTISMVALQAQAATIVSDPDANTAITHCGWYVDSAPKEVLPAPKDAAGKPFCSKDVSALAAGTHSVKASFVVRAPGFADQEGPLSQSLAFVVPSAPTTAPKLKIELSITQ